MNVLEAITSRRSIRRYKTDPVDDQVVTQLLDAARQAPSWANTQCWRFIVVRDAKTKEQLAATLINNPATKAMTIVPVVIVACAQMGVSGVEEGHVATDKGDWFMFDVGIAMQNLVLAAHSLGLGTVHVGRFDAKKAASVLGVPDGYCVVEMTPLGYPDQQPNPRPRKELSEVVFYEGWGKK